MKRGRMVYVPPAVLKELNEIMKEDGLEIKSEGFRKMARYSKERRDKIFESLLDPSPSKSVFKTKKSKGAFLWQ